MDHVHQEHRIYAYVLWLVQMMGGDTARTKPRIDIAIPMALVSKSVTSELNRPGAKSETLHGQYSCRASVAVLPGP